MNRAIQFFLLFPSLLAGMAPKPELTRDFWNNPSFVRSFMGEYGFRSEIEPKISRSEQEVLRQVVAKAENQLLEAIAYLEAEIDSDNSAALDFALATMYYQASRLTSARKTYLQAIKKFPAFLRAHKNLGFVNLNLNDFENASLHLTKAISLGDADGVTYVALGFCQLSLERYLSAENAYRMGLLLLPESKDARNGLVNCFLFTERYPQALALLDEMLEKDAHDTFCHRARASVLQQMGQDKNAAVALETLKRMKKLKASDYMVLGDLYHNLSLFEKSFGIYEEALRQKEKLSLEQYIRVARILIGRGSYQEGFSYLDQIESIFGKGYSEEDEKKIRLLQAEVLRATGKDQSARKILEEIVRKHPLEGEALLILGQLAWKQKDYAEASLRFERAAKDSEHEVRALIEHARMMVSKNQYEKASSLLERAQSIDPQPRVAKYLKSINNLLASSRIRF